MIEETYSIRCPICRTNFHRKVEIKESLFNPEEKSWKVVCEKGHEFDCESSAGLKEGSSE